MSCGISTPSDDALTGGTNGETGDAVTIEPGSDGQETINVLDSNDLMKGTINENNITVPNPADPEN